MRLLGVFLLLVTSLATHAQFRNTLSVGIDVGQSTLYPAYLIDKKVIVEGRDELVIDTAYEDSYVSLLPEIRGAIHSDEMILDAELGGILFLIAEGGASTTNDDFTFGRGEFDNIDSQFDSLKIDPDVPINGYGRDVSLFNVDLGFGIAGTGVYVGPYLNWSRVSTSITNRENLVNPDIQASTFEGEFNMVALGVGAHYWLKDQSFGSLKISARASYLAGGRSNGMGFDPEIVWYSNGERLKLFVGGYYQTRTIKEFSYFDEFSMTRGGVTIGVLLNSKETDGSIKERKEKKKKEKDKEDKRGGIKVIDKS